MEVAVPRKEWHRQIVYIRPPRTCNGSARPQLGLRQGNTTSYNERGDIREERKTATSNLTHPFAGAFTIDEDGTIIPDRREGVSDPPPDLERTQRTITEYRYEYDQNNNWTERTIVIRQEVNSGSGEYSTVYRRTVTYF